MFKLTEKNETTGKTFTIKCKTLAEAISEGQEMFGIDLTNGSRTVGRFFYEISGNVDVTTDRTKFDAFGNPR